MTTVTDWLMVGITLVYVVATIFIWRANSKSAEATKEQVAESKRQFKETQRLEVMPYLQFESCDGLTNYSLDLALVSGDHGGGTYIFKCKVKNIGHGTAKDITYIYHSLTDSYNRGSFPIKALQSGDENYIRISFSMPQNRQNNLCTSFELSFKDLLEHKYTQVFEMIFEYSANQLKLKEHTTKAPLFIEQEDSNA